MSRDDGFPVMDISTSIVHDPKFRQLYREQPDHVAPAFLAYIAMLGESWQAGHRVSVTDAWPTLLPFDGAVVTSMIRVRLVDKSGLPPRKSWSGWFHPASERRERSRERWRRANANRSADTSDVPRGMDDVPMPPSVPPVRPPKPSAPSSARAKRHGINPEEERRLALLELSEKFQRNEIDQMTYERERRVLAS